MTRLLATAALVAALVVPAATAATRAPIFEPDGSVTVASAGSAVRPAKATRAPRLRNVSLCETNRPGGLLADQNGITIHRCQ